MPTQATLVRTVKPVVFLAALAPAAWLVWGLAAGRLGANPVEAITDVTGIWTLRFLMLTLAVTPLRRVTGWQWLVRYRRMLGLFAFFYATLHFSTYLVLDQSLQFEFLAEDVARRPFITVGFAALLTMVPLALTSTSGMIRRLGGRRWQQLHRLVYVTAVCGVLHYLWVVKLDTSAPLGYGALVAALLAARFWMWRAKRAATPGRPRERHADAGLRA